MPIDIAGALMGTIDFGADVSGAAVAVSKVAINAIVVDPIGAGLLSSDVTCY